MDAAWTPDPSSSRIIKRCCAVSVDRLLLRRSFSRIKAQLESLEPPLLDLLRRLPLERDQLFERFPPAPVPKRVYQNENLPGPARELLDGKWRVGAQRQLRGHRPAAVEPSEGG